MAWLPFLAVRFASKLVRRKRSDKQRAREHVVPQVAKPGRHPPDRLGQAADLGARGHKHQEGDHGAVQLDIFQDRKA